MSNRSKWRNIVRTNYPNIKILHPKLATRQHEGGRLSSQWERPFTQLKENCKPTTQTKMEIQNNINSEHIPLLEVVEASPGANTGDGSMQTVGDQLQDGALVGEPEEATINNNPTTSITHARCVLRPITTSTTRAGLPRQRIQWTTQMNKEVLRCFYLATKLETQLHVYRPLLRDLFLRSFPELNHLSEQNIADRRRAIVKKNLLSVTEINDIRTHVSQELRAENSPPPVMAEPQTDQDNRPQTTEQIALSHGQNELLPLTSSDNIDYSRNRRISVTSQTAESENENVLQQSLLYNFRSAKEELENTCPSRRESLPKLRITPRVNNMFSILNLRSCLRALIIAKI